MCIVQRNIQRVVMLRCLLFYKIKRARILRSIVIYNRRIVLYWYHRRYQRFHYISIYNYIKLLYILAKFYLNQCSAWCPYYGKNVAIVMHVVMLFVLGPIHHFQMSTGLSTIYINGDFIKSFLSRKKFELSTNGF